MKNTVATASKNLLAIKKREFSHKTFRAMQRLAGGPADDISSVVFYPEIDESNQLGDIINRLGWYLPNGSFEDLQVNLLTEAPITEALAPPEQNEYPTEHLCIETHPPQETRRIASSSDRILIWDKSSRLTPTTIPQIQKVGMVDPQYYSLVESDTWATVSERIRNDVSDTSSENFQELERRASDSDTSYVFATGPSLDDVFDIEIPSSALSIICNSIVRNDELLEHVNPDVLVFADPVFHFGPSKYAHAFREDAAATLKQYDCVAVVPQRYHSLLAGHYPELSDQLIGMTSVTSTNPIYPTSERLEVMGTSNIMTLYMLPIAMSLTDNVRIVGADGRKEDESYFWEHSDTAQYDDELMKTVAEAHPSFFRDRVYEDYYEEHVETLTEMIEFGEADGIEFQNITNSYIPSLAERRVEPE